MDRFQWWEGGPEPGETDLLSQSGVRLYDGNKKTQFESGTLSLSSHRVRWQADEDTDQDMVLRLSRVVLLEKEAGGWTRSPKVVAHLSAILEEDKRPGPVKYSPFNYVKFSFRGGGDREFFNAFSEAVRKKAWEEKTKSRGIGGIERQRRQRNEAAEGTLQEAFEDLKCLMGKAAEVVKLAKSVAQRVTTEDETTRLKQQLLSLGCASADATGSSFHEGLAAQLGAVLEAPMREAGGVLSLTEAYCRINRARGVQLVSPEDLLAACRGLEDGLLQLHVFESSGVMVLRLRSHDAEDEARRAADLLKDEGSLTPHQLSGATKTTLVVARERLLGLERAGVACRDDSIEGLRFYPNRFLAEGA